MEKYDLLPKQLIHEGTCDPKDFFSPKTLDEDIIKVVHQKDYVKALEQVNKTIDEYNAELDIILGNAYLLQGMCYDRLDQRGKAKGSYKDCIALDNFSGSIKIAKDYLKKPFSGI